jgi:AraC-like DNA-binding protein
MIQLNRAVLKHDSEFIQTNTSNKKIVECIDYINTHLQEPISPDSLAKQFYLSKYHLMHCFKEETGCSIGSYLSTKRLLLAREYIQEGMSATQACYECGFHNYSTFFRAWKKCFGNSPTSKKEMWEV